jgi:sugar phosphate permease
MKSQKSRQSRIVYGVTLLHFSISGGYFAAGFQTSSFVPKTHFPSVNHQSPYTHPMALYSQLKEPKAQKTNSNTVFQRIDLQEEISSEKMLEPYQVQNVADADTIYVMMSLIFAIGSLSALDRVAMSVALVPMSEEMGYTDTIKGSISSLFSVGYGLGIVPAGLLLASFSPRIIMAVGIGFWSAGTLATPFSAAQANMGFLLGARALVGASESVVIPTVQRLLSNWVPPDKKGLAVATVFASFQTGTIMAYSLSPIIIDQLGDWRSLFYM